MPSLFLVGSCPESAGTSIGRLFAWASRRQQLTSRGETKCFLLAKKQHITRVSSKAHMAIINHAALARCSEPSAALAKGPIIRFFGVFISSGGCEQALLTYKLLYTWEGSPRGSKTQTSRSYNLTLLTPCDIYLMPPPQKSLSIWWHFSQFVH